MDALAPDARLIESEIDSYHRQNPLVNLPFARAAWLSWPLRNTSYSWSYYAVTLKSEIDFASIISDLKLVLRGSF
jgi:hypothetical protein